MKRPPKAPGDNLERDWDWHRLIEECQNESELALELRRLIVEEGFIIDIGDWDHNVRLDKDRYEDVEQVCTAVKNTPDDRWVGFQLFYPMTKPEVRSCSGAQFVEAVTGVFNEVIPAMNACMQVRLISEQKLPSFATRTD